MELEQFYVNIARPGNVEIEGFYENKEQNFHIIKYAESGSIVYSQLFEIEAWKGSISAKTTFISILETAQALSTFKLVCEMLSKSLKIEAEKKFNLDINLINYEAKSRIVDFSRLIIVIANAQKEIVGIAPIQLNELKSITLKARSETKIRLEFALKLPAGDYRLQVQFFSVIPKESADGAAQPVPLKVTK